MAGEDFLRVADRGQVNAGVPFQQQVEIGGGLLDLGGGELCREGSEGGGDGGRLHVLLRMHHRDREAQRFRENNLKLNISSILALAGLSLVYALRCRCARALGRAEMFLLSVTPGLRPGLHFTSPLRGWCSSRSRALGSSRESAYARSLACARARARHQKLLAARLKPCPSKKSATQTGAPRECPESAL